MQIAALASAAKADVRDTTHGLALLQAAKHIRLMAMALLIYCRGMVACALYRDCRQPPACGPWAWCPAMPVRGASRVCPSLGCTRWRAPGQTSEGTLGWPCKGRGPAAVHGPAALPSTALTRSAAQQPEPCGRPAWSGLTGPDAPAWAPGAGGAWQWGWGRARGGRATVHPTRPASREPIHPPSGGSGTRASRPH
jgi:hypothetical protein